MHREQVREDRSFDALGGSDAAVDGLTSGCRPLRVLIVTP